MSAAGIKGIDAKPFSEHPLNGRQIKNCICLSQGLAKADNTIVTKEHIERTIRVCMEFVLEMEHSNRLTGTDDKVIPIGNTAEMSFY